MHLSKRKAVSALCGIFLMMFCLGIWTSPRASACGWSSSDVNNSIERAFWDKLTERAVSKASRVMHGCLSASNAIVVTNAGYAMIDGHGTATCLDSLMNRTGATPGKMTLIDVHSSKDGQFWIFLYDRYSGNAVYLEPDHDVVAGLLAGLSSDKKRASALIPVSDETLFSFVGSGKFKPDTMFTAIDGAGPKVDEYEANLIQTGGAFHGNEFRIMGIVLAIVDNAPTDVMRSIQFHDHYCPGVTSGIMLVRYIEKNFPDYTSFVFSIPPWCKDDAFMVMLNKTPGKSGYGVTYLTDADKALLNPAYSTVAGVFFGKNSEGLWEGKVVGFDFNKLSVTVGSYPSWQTKLKMDEEYLKYLDAPETFVSLLKTVTLPAGMSPSDCARPGVNQLELFGLL